jgi:hypothetical protein
MAVTIRFFSGLLPMMFRRRSISVSILFLFIYIVSLYRSSHALRALVTCNRGLILSLFVCLGPNFNTKAL